MLSILLSCFWVQLVMDQKLKEILCVSYFAGWILG